MPVNDGDIVQAIVEAVMDDGSIVQNKFVWEAALSAAISNSATVAAVGAWLDLMYTEVEPYISGALTWNPIAMSRLQYNDDNNFWEVIELLGEYATTIEGTGIQDPLPNQMAAVARGVTNRPKTFGRKFLYGWVETCALGGDLITAALTALADFVDLYIEDIDMGTVGALSPGVVRTGVDDFRDFRSGVANSIMGTQRRRKPGVGV